MGTQFFDLDIDAKLPIIRAESAENPFSNGIVEINNHHSQQNGITNYHHDGDNHHHPNHTNHNKSKNHNHCNNSNSCSSIITNSKNNNNNNINNNNHHLDLPKPTFRLLDSNRYKRRTHTAKLSKIRRTRDSHTTESYYHYEEPTADDLLERVEYDMDAEDSAWLTYFNENQGSHYDYVVTENDFEKIMDRLEKESHFESQSSGNSIVPEVDEDAVCAICNDGDCHNANVILFCDMCDLAVHQECYGVPYIPEGQWLCRRCLQSPSRNVECILCPNKGGAFKQTDDNRWAHVICALWVPEVCFANTVFLEPIDSIDQIPAARWKLTCYICKQKKKGACIQCHKPNCYVPFHVTCAQQAGLHMKIRTFRYDTPDGCLTDVKKEAFCDAHGPQDSTKKRAMYSGDETDEEDVDNQAYKKWKQTKREKMKKTRKILAEKRAKAFNPIAKPQVNGDKLIEISKLLTLRGRRKPPPEFEELRKVFIRHILGYWLTKRDKRNGVPLLRRLQVSYNNSVAKGFATSLQDLDKERYTKLRYDLEKARLLVGEVKKREIFKKKLFKISKEIVEKKFQVIDYEHPPIEE